MEIVSVNSVCLGKIDARLKSFDGYILMLANIEKGLLAVAHRRYLNVGRISKAITALGYPAEVASEAEHRQPLPLSSEFPSWISPSKGIIFRLLQFFIR